MTTYRVEDLTGALLDAPVAKAEGIAFRICNSAEGQFLRTGVAGSGLIEGYHDLCIEGYRPSQSWADGGPILDREQIGVVAFSNGEWLAGYGLHGDGQYIFGDHEGEGPTALVAGMRSFVTNKLGATIDL